MVEVDDSLMAEHVIAEALEVGEFDMPGSIGLGEYGQHEQPLEWDIENLNPESCDVHVDDGVIHVTGTIEGTYSVQTSRGSRHHPAEYENKDVTIFVTITRPLGDMSAPQVYGEIA